jgi:hypothetical protein
LSKETAQTIKEMAALVMKTNRITPIHETNMKMYPLIFFNGVTAVKIDYDLHVRDDVEVDDQANKLIIKAPIRNNYVAYYLTVDENSDNSNINKRLEALETSTRTLFWNDVVVEVYINDQIIYKSKKNVGK